MASDEFQQLSGDMHDIALADTIFKYGVQVTGGDYREALLALTFASLPYNEVPIIIPFINLRLVIPLYSSAHDMFIRKNQNLPKYFFYDSPRNDYGDKDKLAHFFGSAFLGYGWNFFDLASVIGYFVEVFEERFKVESSVDERDLEVNAAGVLFGEALSRDKTALPSSYLMFRSLQLLRLPIGI